MVASSTPQPYLWPIYGLLLALSALLLIGQAAADDPANDPTVEIQAPEAGSTVTGQVNLTGEASDPQGNETLQSVEVRVKEDPEAAWQTANRSGADWSAWYYLWDALAYDDGEYVLQARAFDGTNYSRWYNHSLWVDNNEPPQITVNLAEQAMLNDTFNLTGTAFDPDGTDNLSHVELSLDDANFTDPIIPNGTASNWFVVWDTWQMASGNYTLYARALDKANLSSPLVQVNFSINHLPNLTFSAPLKQWDWTFAFQWNSSDPENQTTFVSLYGYPLSTPAATFLIAADLPGNGSYYWNSSAREPEEYGFYGLVYDAPGQMNRTDMAQTGVVPVIVTRVLSPQGDNDSADFDFLVRWQVEGIVDDRQVKLYLDDDTDPAEHRKVLATLEDFGEYNLATRLIDEGFYYLRVEVTQWDYTTYNYSGRIEIAHNNTAPGLVFTYINRQDWDFTLQWESTDPENDPREVGLYLRPRLTGQDILLAANLSASGSLVWDSFGFEDPDLYYFVGKVEDELGAASETRTVDHYQVPKFLVYFVNPGPTGDDADISYILRWRVEGEVDTPTPTLFFYEASDLVNATATVNLIQWQTNYEWDASLEPEGVYQVRIVVTENVFSQEALSGPLEVLHALRQPIDLLEVTQQPLEPKAGVRIAFTTTLENPSLHGERLELHYWIDGQLIATHDYYLTAKTTGSDEFSWTAQPGQHNLLVQLKRPGEADPDEELTWVFTVPGIVEQSGEEPLKWPLYLLTGLILAVLIGALVVTGLLPVGRWGDGEEDEPEEPPAEPGIEQSPAGPEEGEQEEREGDEEEEEEEEEDEEGEAIDFEVENGPDKADVSSVTQNADSAEWTRPDKQ